MSLHVNPLNVSASEDGIELAPEIMVLYPEGSSEFEYIRSLIGEWEYYVSPVVKIPDAVAKIMVQSGGMIMEEESECYAYIYGWMPGDVEWIQGSCTAIVFFEKAALTVQAIPVSCRIHLQIEGLFRFSRERTVPILFEQVEQVEG